MNKQNYSEPVPAQSGPNPAVLKAMKELEEVYGALPIILNVENAAPLEELANKHARAGEMDIAGVFLRLAGVLMRHGQLVVARLPTIKRRAGA